MSKYIDAEELKTLIRNRKNIIKASIQSGGDYGQSCSLIVYDRVLSMITSLQQEQPDCHTVEDWMQHIKNADQLTKDIFSNGPYDVLYDALNYPYQNCYDAIKEFGELCFQTGVNSVKQEQPEVELKPIWHNVAEEIPTEIGAEVIVACKNKNKECGIGLYDLIQCWEGEWKPRVNWETPIRWAYVRDLDSARKEE